jgi:hypothetical protein
VRSTRVDMTVVHDAAHTQQALVCRTADVFGSDVVSVYRRLLAELRQLRADIQSAANRDPRRLERSPGVPGEPPRARGRGVVRVDDRLTADQSHCGLVQCPVADREPARQIPGSPCRDGS